MASARPHLLIKTATSKRSIFIKKEYAPFLYFTPTQQPSGQKNHGEQKPARREALCVKSKHAD